jgi:hypothetical protein
MHRTPPRSDKRFAAKPCKAAHRLGVKWLKMAGPRKAPMPIAPNSSPMVNAESRIWKAGASENLRPGLRCPWRRKCWCTSIQIKGVRMALGLCHVSRSGSC